MSAGDAVNSVLTNYTSHLNSIAPGAVLIQLGLMGAIGLVALIAFSLLRPNNSVIYQPKVKYSEDGKSPPRIEKKFLGWVKPLLSTKEDILMDTIGLDAVCFLRFLRMCRNIFTFLALVSCIALLPVNIAYNLTQVKADNRNWLSMLTIQQVTGNWLWAHVGCTYIVTLVIYYFVWTNYDQMVKLRWQWFRSDEYQNSMHSRSLLVTQVSKSYQSDPGLLNLLQQLQIPYPTTAIHIGRKVGSLPTLIDEHNECVRSLEGVLGRYLAAGGEAKGVKRPTIRMGGTMGCGGRKVDAIDNLTQKIQRLEERIEITRKQIGDKKAENYGFASFESVPYAHIVAKKLTGRTKNGSTLNLAPTPHDIIWENLTMPRGKQTRNKILGAVLLVVFLFLYIIPLLAVSLLANLSALSAYVNFIEQWIVQQPFLFSAFVGIVPPLCSVLLQLILPMIMRWIATFEGTTTHSQSDRVVTARYSAFLFFTQFFLFSLLGLIVQIISQVVIQVSGKKSISVIWAYLRTVPDQFQSTWIIQSTYWLTVFPLRGSSAIFDLAQVVSLLIVWGRTKLFGRTPREIREWTAPPEFDYAVYIANHLLMVAVGFVYCPLAPLVPLFAAFAFAISTWVYKYQLMYVCASKVETGGRLWRVIVNRILAAVVMMQLLILLTVGLKVGWYYAISLAPAVISVIVFKIVLSRKFDERFKWFIPSQAEIAETHLHSADARKNRLEKRFGHPSLHDSLFTPMLHKGVQHLLPNVYNGRIDAARGNIDGKAVDQSTAGGLTFNLLESHDLTMDRGTYLRQRDEDEQTVSTSMGMGAKSPSTIGRGGSNDDYFNARRTDYLNKGTYAQTSDGLPYQLRRMDTQATGVTTPGGGGMVASSSQENLIQYPPVYNSQPPSRDQYRLPPSSTRQNQMGSYENEKYPPQDQTQSPSAYSHNSPYQGQPAPTFSPPLATSRNNNHYNTSNQYVDTPPLMSPPIAYTNPPTNNTFNPDRSNPSTHQYHNSNPSASSFDFGNFGNPELNEGNLGSGNARSQEGGGGGYYHSQDQDEQYERVSMGDEQRPPASQNGNRNNGRRY